MRLPRPYIPFLVRLQVAHRQLRQQGITVMMRHKQETQSAALLRLLNRLSEVYPWSTDGADWFDLHHIPALCNRQRRTLAEGAVVYDPPANDPDHLVYLRARDHVVVTRVRGFFAQRSDQSQLRYNKRVQRNREKWAAAAVSKENGSLLRASRAKRRAQRTTKSRVKYNPKYNWPSRPLRNRGFEKKKDPAGAGP